MSNTGTAVVLTTDFDLGMDYIHSNYTPNTNNSLALAKAAGSMLGLEADQLIACFVVEKHYHLTQAQDQIDDSLGLITSALIEAIAAKFKVKASQLVEYTLAHHGIPDHLIGGVS